MKIVQALENSNILLKGVAKTIKMKQQKMRIFKYVMKQKNEKEDF